MPTITMTREMGSLGNRVAAEVSKRLGLRLVYQELVQGVADRMHMAPSAVGRFVEGDSTLVERFFVDPRKLGLCTAEEILELAARGDVLIRGWGADAVLESFEHVLRVRVCAPMELRVDRMLKRTERLDARAVAEEIAASDRQHAAVLERVHGANGWRDPGHYHLVLDTGEISVEECVERVIATASSPPFVETDAGRALLRDRLLAARIKAALREAPGGSDMRIVVAAKDGVVTLEGIVASDREASLAEGVARRFAEVARVENRLAVMREAAIYSPE